MPTIAPIFNDKGQLPPGEHVKLLRRMSKGLPKADMEAEIESAHEALSARGVREGTGDRDSTTLLTLTQRIQLLGT